MRISFLILISLAVNVALAALFFRPGHGAGPGTVGDVPAENPAAAGENPGGAQNENTTATTPTGKISWRDLQAAELRKFVGNLRAVGCPEETIKDLVLAELNGSVSKQQRAIWGEQPNQDYWKPYQRKSDPEERKKNRDRSKQMQALNKEKTALIVELFGVDVEKQRRKEEGFDTDNLGWNPGGNLAFLPEAKREAVQKYLEDFNEKEQDFYASTMGGWDADARARQKKNSNKKNSTGWRSS